jgi:small subunit ribosomal protein S4
MARDTSPIVKQSRREGYALHPKAAKIMAKKTAIPGQHGHDRQGKASLYSRQLREKQKVRRIYGLLEKQFAGLMRDASRMKGQSGEMLLQLLERRLDNAVYRAGFAISRRGARQLVTHGHFLLNGRRVDIPSIRLKEGDVIEVRGKSFQSTYFKNIKEVLDASSQGNLGWLKSDAKKLVITVAGTPARDDAENDINEQLIVEYYSR